MSEIDFLVEDDGDIIAKYKLSIVVGNLKLAKYNNDLNLLKKIYDDLVEDYLNNSEHVVIVIYDYDKDTNIYSFDSEEDL